MQFLIADTFVDSLAKLSSQEQKAVKTTAFDLQLNPASPGMSLHKLDRAQDPNFASVRVNQDVRLILYRAKDSLIVCYVGHHNDAYRWAQKRRMETHPATGAAQLIEIRETVEEIVIPNYVVPERQKPPLFAGVSETELLGYGVPVEWMVDVRQATEDNLLDLTDHLPKEAAEALLELAVGGTPTVPAVAEPAADPFEHPDALRRFRVMQDVEELERALEFPWEKWTLFLHPHQRQVVETDFNGPARVSGSAGTGKTVVALHRAVHLAKQHPDARVLLATFSEALAGALRTKLNRLIHHQPRLAERIEVYAMDAIGERLYGLGVGKLGIGKLKIAARSEVQAAIDRASAAIGEHGFSRRFLYSEWEQVVDAWQLGTWEEYRDVARLGRKTRLPEGRRRVLWSIYERVRADLKSSGTITPAEMFARLAAHFEGGAPSPFDFVVVDESQDINVAQLRFLAALMGGAPNGLFFAGDLGQRIFQQPFSWKSLGVDIRGRSRTLRVNYRTSHQIRMQADRLLGPEISDVDGISEARGGTVSVFNGPEPEIEVFDSQGGEIDAVGRWLAGLAGDGVVPEEIGVFVRSGSELARAVAAVEAAGLAYRVLDERVSSAAGFVSIATMHLAKGLEFRAVVVMACDDEVIPLQERIEQAADEADLEEVYNTERQLLYVACTRARDRLMVCGVEPVSEFVGDLF